LAGIGTLDFPGCQRVIEPVSRLFFINPATGKSERTMQIKNPETTNQNSISFPGKNKVKTWFEVT
jgi:hypothetical protein